MHRLRPELFSLVLITLAMAPHFVISDHGLRHQWPNAYDRGIRWVLTIALLAGWALGVWIPVSSEVIALSFAFLAGGMLIITIREELPKEESGSFWAFLLGVAAYTALLLVIEQMPRTVIDCGILHQLLHSSEHANRPTRERARRALGRYV